MQPDQKHNSPPNTRNTGSAQSMNRPADQTTLVMGYPTRYWQVGTQGSPLVLIHGISCSVLEWEHVINDLAKKHRVFALDLLGHGLTAKPTDSPYDLASLAQFVLAFMDAVGLSSASLCGNSLGARLALECAAIAPQRVLAMVLSAPAAVEKTTLFEFRVASLPWLGEIATAPNTFGTGKIWRSAFANPAFATPHMVAEKVALAKLPGAGPAFLKALRYMLGFGGFKPAVLADTHAKMRWVVAPTLVIWGRQDRFLPLAHLTTFMQHMPQAESVVLEKCGHAPMIEHSAKFSQLALDFLAKKADGAPAQKA